MLLGDDTDDSASGPTMCITNLFGTATGNDYRLSVRDTTAGPAIPTPHVDAGPGQPANTLFVRAVGMDNPNTDPATAYWDPNAKFGDALGGWEFQFDIVGTTSDTDGDGIPDPQDNCVSTANPSQIDANGDGIGNACDADINNSGLVTATDFNLLRACINQPGYPTGTAQCRDSDMNGSGTVTATDFNLLRTRVNQSATGLSGLACADTTAPFSQCPAAAPTVFCGYLPSNQVNANCPAPHNVCTGTC